MRGQPSVAGQAQRLRDARGELRLARRQRREAALAGGEIARRRVDQHALQVVLREPRGDLGRRNVVREGELDSAKTGARRRAEAIEEREFVEQKAEVGGKARHSSPCGGRVGGCSPHVRKREQTLQCSGRVCATDGARGKHRRRQSNRRRRLRCVDTTHLRGPIPAWHALTRNRSSPATLSRPAVATSASPLAGFATATLAGEAVLLLAERAIHWPGGHTLFVADVHLGKAAAFRAGGVAIPRGATAHDLARLAALDRAYGGAAPRGAGRLPARRRGTRARARRRLPALARRACGARDHPGARQPRRARGRSAARLGHRGRPRSARARAVRALPCAGLAGHGPRAVRACAPGRAADRGARESVRLPCFVLGPAAHAAAGVRTIHGARARHARTGAKRSSPSPATAAVQPPRASRCRSRLGRSCGRSRERPRAFVAKLQRAGNRSSAGLPVDKPVNMRWNVLAYAANGAAGGCFCCRFSTPLLCIKKRLPSVSHPTMLGAHQALQHKM